MGSELFGNANVSTTSVLKRLISQRVISDIRRPNGTVVCWDVYLALTLGDMEGDWNAFKAFAGNQTRDGSSPQLHLSRQINGLDFDPQPHF